MNFSSDQLILASHVRKLAHDMWLGERNALSDQWHAANPGETREMSEFAAELKATKSFNNFVVSAYKELENVATVIAKASAPEELPKQ